MGRIAFGDRICGVEQFLLPQSTRRTQRSFKPGTGLNDGFRLCATRTNEILCRRGKRISSLCCLCSVVIKILNPANPIAEGVLPILFFPGVAVEIVFFCFSGKNYRNTIYKYISMEI